MSNKIKVKTIEVYIMKKKIGNMVIYDFDINLLCLPIKFIVTKTKVNINEKIIIMLKG
jgi:hypothetical protein